MATLAPSFLIGSSSFLQVTSTTIKSHMSSKFGQIGSRTLELASLSILKNPHRLTMGEILSPLLRLHFEWIFFIFCRYKGHTLMLGLV